MTRANWSSLRAARAHLTTSGRAAAASALMAAMIAGCQSAPEPVVAPALPPPPIAAVGHTGLDPHSGGSPASVLVLFHGEGQSADTMRSLAQSLAPQLPDTLFVFDNGLVRNGDMYSWYRASDTDTASRQLAYNHATRLVATLSNIYGVHPSKIATVGFAQGAEVAVVSASCTLPVSAASVAVAGVVATRCENAKDPALLVLPADSAPSASQDAAMRFVLEHLK